LPETLEDAMQKLIAALNSIASQPLSFALIVVGCIFAVVSKKNGMDVSISATIIGTGLGILKGDGNKQHDPPPPPAPGLTAQITETQSATSATFPSPGNPTK
jgi:hypothetical protein